MSKCKFRGVGIAAEAFDENNLTYDVHTLSTGEALYLSIPVRHGPTFHVFWANTDDGNDLLVYIPTLVGDIPEERRAHAMAVCNQYADNIRWINLYVDEDGDVGLRYALPKECDDESLKEIAMGLLYIIHRFLDDHYKDLLMELS